MRWAAILLLLIPASLFWAQRRSGPIQPHFRDITSTAGLTVSHRSSPEKRYIIESMSGGVGFIDCDGDGRLDIVRVIGSSVDRYLQGGDLMVTLYRQVDSLKLAD